MDFHLLFSSDVFASGKAWLSSYIQTCVYSFNLALDSSRGAVYERRLYISQSYFFFNYRGKCYTEKQTHFRTPFVIWSLKTSEYSVPFSLSGQFLCRMNNTIKVNQTWVSGYLKLLHVGSVLTAVYSIYPKCSCCVQDGVWVNIPWPYDEGVKPF